VAPATSRARSGWRRTRRTDSVSTTWPATSGNGTRTCGAMPTSPARRGRAACCAEARGSTTPPSCAPRSAADGSKTARAATSSAGAACASGERPRALGGHRRAHGRAAAAPPRGQPERERAPPLLRVAREEVVAPTARLDDVIGPQGEPDALLLPAWQVDSEGDPPQTPGAPEVVVWVVSGHVEEPLNTPGERGAAAPDTWLPLHVGPHLLPESAG